jgi:uncharacterized OB-fold protein
MSPELKRDYQFSGKAKIFSYTIIGNPEHAPKGFQEQVPYLPALIKLDEGPLLTAMLTDLDHHYEEEIIQGEKRMVKKFNVEIGMPVEMVTRLLKIDGDEDRGLRIYGYKFRPILQRSVPSK